MPESRPDTIIEGRTRRSYADTLIPLLFVPARADIEHAHATVAEDISYWARVWGEGAGGIIACAVVARVLGRFRAIDAKEGGNCGGEVAERRWVALPRVVGRRGARRRNDFKPVRIRVGELNFRRSEGLPRVGRSGQKYKRKNDKNNRKSCLFLHMEETRMRLELV